MSLVEPAQRDMRRSSVRFQGSGDEAGTAPGDRPFRPDVEGLRAVAVVLVVLFHAGAPSVTGGFIGVDVFFVISGFVITGLLLRERTATAKTSILSFYSRRCRRIIPAAALVIVVTVAASYFVLGSAAGVSTADDGRWAAIFLANFHFVAIGTNYFTANRPPSPLQNFWSLAVEEQFYIIYPTLFAVLASLRLRLSLRARLALGLSAVIVASFVFSVIQTSANPTVAYFSPLTRAWELAVGALVAVGTEWLLRLPARFAAVLTWAGLAAVVTTAFVFGPQTPYPGSLVAIPVVGAALIIAGGVVAPRGGAEALLGLRPLRFIGKLSYSLYLWHWPILALAAESVGKNSLPFHDNLVWIAVALIASVVSFYVVENPIRHAKAIIGQRWASVGIGACVTALVFVLASQLIYMAAPAGAAGIGVDHVHRKLVPLSSVLQAVQAATHVSILPTRITPSLDDVQTDFGVPATNFPCWPKPVQTSVPPCVFGDRNGTHTMVLVGDSHAAMWFQAFDDIAVRLHWRLILLAHGSCAVDILPYAYDPGQGPLDARWPVCDKWHTFIVNRINSIKPDLLVVTQRWRGFLWSSAETGYPPKTWQTGLERFFHLLKTPQTHVVVLGDTPDSPGPNCLAIHTADIQACSGTGESTLTPSDKAELAAVTSIGGRYINVKPWLCAQTCPEVIAHRLVYYDYWHITAAYSLYLEGPLIDALALSEPDLLTTAK